MHDVSGHGIGALGTRPARSYSHGARIFPSAGAIVSATGVLEILGALGLVIPITARTAAVCLAIMLVAMFPANIRAARERLTILGRPAINLAVRGAMQLLFMAALLAVAAHL